MLYLKKNMPKRAFASVFQVNAEDLAEIRSRNKDKWNYISMVSEAEFSSEIKAYKIDLFSEESFYNVVLPDAPICEISKNKVLKINGFWYQRAFIDLIRTKSGKGQIIIYPQQTPLLVISDLEKTNYIFIAGLAT